ncbi:MAG: riboflavin biosynthesis protein RibF [Candidatus Omnitrophica bacterium]|nr:riboflavin biosynthesis protein RibF [Candidatus Omnitrophota bacterium]
MRVIYDINRIKKFPNPVVAMGVFDGVHRGHKVILASAVRKSRAIGGTSVAITFWPHPQKEGSLSSLKHRLELIASLGIDVAIVISFNRRFSRITAANFIKKFLVEKIGAKYIYVGQNFRFGRNARGSLDTFKRFSAIYGFKTKAINVIKVADRPISSTLIRTLIKKGDLLQAESLLGRAVGILGTVIKGNLFARKLGFPTANITPHHEVIPPCGIYAVRVVFKGKTYGGVCYIGRQPSFLTRSKKIHIEVHIFAFRKKIYGQELKIDFVQKIRNERRFKDIASLTQQIKKDVFSAKSILSRHK